MPKIMLEGKEEYVDGFISKIQFPNGKVYALRCETITVKPIVCPKCGGTVTLKYGEGKCDFCGVCYTSKFELVETSAISGG
jgi:hypothetical protein